MTTRWAGSSLARWLVQLDRERLAHEIVLKPLERAEVEAMLQAIFQSQQPVRPEFLDPLVELTEGNPFFVEEVLQSLVAAGDILPSRAQWDRKPMHEIHIPRSVHETVQRRAAQLSETARRSVLLAAVAGRRFDFDLLQALAAPSASRTASPCGILQGRGVSLAGRPRRTASRVHLASRSSGGTALRGAVEQDGVVLRDLDGPCASPILPDAATSSECVNR